MPDYDNNMRGVLFKNDKKQSDKHPDYKGNAEIEGVEYWVSAWIKTSGKGAKFMSMSFQAKEEQPAPQQTSRPPASRQAPPSEPYQPVDSDSIPF
jgi:hypothetical protein